MKSTTALPTWATQSPWLDTIKPNLFRDEFRLIAVTKIQPELLGCGPYITPSWAIETSPSNCRYGYIFSEPITDLNEADPAAYATGKEGAVK